MQPPLRNPVMSVLGSAQVSMTDGASPTAEFAASFICSGLVINICPFADGDLAISSIARPRTHHGGLCRVNLMMIFLPYIYSSNVSTKMWNTVPAAPCLPYLVCVALTCARKFSSATQRSQPTTR